MPVTLPTTAEITAQNIAAFEARIGQTIPTLSKAFFRVLAAIEAGMFTTHYRYAANRILQCLAITASGIDLDIIGANYDVQRTPATPWKGTIRQPATMGTVIPITVDYVGDSNSIRYLVDAAAVAGAGNFADVDVTAVTSGALGNLATGDTCTISTAIAGLTSTTATWLATTQTGADAETDEEYRRRVLLAIRTVAGGGTAADYRAWGEAVTGVFRVFPFAGAPAAFTHKIVDHDMQAATVDAWNAGGAATLTKETAAPAHPDGGGKRWLKITSTGPLPYAYQYALEVGRSYTLTGRFYSTSGGSIYNPGLGTLWSSGPTGAWVPFSVTFTPTTSTELRLQALAGISWAGFAECDLVVDDSLPGDRVVYVEADTDIDPDGIPTDALLDDVRDAINADPDSGASRVMLGLTDEKLFIEPIERDTIDVTITSLVVDAAKEVDCKADISTALDEYLRLVAPFVDGVDSEIDRIDVVTAVTISEVLQGVLSTYQASVTSVTFESGGIPLTTLTVAENQLLKLGAVTYA